MQFLKSPFPQNVEIFWGDRTPQYILPAVNVSGASVPTQVVVD